MHLTDAETTTITRNQKPALKSPRSAPTSLPAFPSSPYDRQHDYNSDSDPSPDSDELRAGGGVGMTLRDL